MFETAVTRTVGLFLSWRRASEILVSPAIQIPLKAVSLKFSIGYKVSPACAIAEQVKASKPDLSSVPRTRQRRQGILKVVL